jgi:Cu/Ag efflux protein CusF
LDALSGWFGRHPIPGSEDPLRKKLLVAIGLAFVSSLSSATWAADQEGHAAHGVVKRVDVSTGTVTIDHEDIPGLMMAMTMEFEVSDPSILHGVSPGQAVDFRVLKKGDRYVVTEIHPAAAGETPGGRGKMKGEMGCCRGMPTAPDHEASACRHGAARARSRSSGVGAS